MLESGTWNLTLGHLELADLTPGTLEPDTWNLASVLLSEVCNFIKIETLAQEFSYEFCEISKNIFFYRTRLGDCFCS